VTTDDDRGRVVEPLVLADGTRAELVRRGAEWVLLVDGIRNSHVGVPGGPPALASVRWMQAALGPAPRRVVHLGGGLLTLPRAVADRTPAAAQLVVELDPVIAGVARDRIGLPAGVHLEVADARAWLRAGPHEAWTGACDAVVVDVFAGGRIPPAFTSRECFAGAADLLASHGVLVVNSVAGGGLEFTRRQVATLRAGFAHVAMVVQGSALKGLRFGNAVLVASAAPLEVERIRAELAGDASRGALVTDLDDLVGDAAVVTDADALWSPAPDLPDLAGALRMVEQAERIGRALGPRAED
jgi:hypothetical protein